LLRGWLLVGEACALELGEVLGKVLVSLRIWEWLKLLKSI
jgi:hypothetical protein